MPSAYGATIGIFLNSLAYTNNANENYLPLAFLQWIIHNVYMYSVMVLFRIVLSFGIMNTSLNILRVGNVAAGKCRYLGEYDTTVARNNVKS